MNKHVDLVGVLYLIWGGMCVLLSVSMLSIGIAATAIGAAVSQSATGGKLAAGIVAAGFFTLAALGFLFGAAHLWVGGRLRRFREWARAFAIILSVVDLFLLPFGTALGVYTLWALIHQDTRPLFERG
ncbi:MAG TPA: hypothetical protein VGK32_16270 [Vicinamibacterales bacterium]|jgi:hypothetical protein